MNFLAVGLLVFIAVLVGGVAVEDCYRKPLPRLTPPDAGPQDGVITSPPEDK